MMNPTLTKVLTVAWRDFKHTALTKAFIIAGVGIPLLIFGGLFLIGALFRPNFAPLEGTIAIVDPTGDVATMAEQEFDPGRLEQRIRAILRTVSDEMGGRRSRGFINQDAILAALPRINVTLEHYDREDEATLNALKERVRQGELVAVAIINPQLLEAVVPPDDELAAAEAITKRPTAGDPNSDSSELGTLPLYLRPGTAPNHTRLIEGSLRDAVIRARAERAGLSYERIQALTARPDVQSIRVTETGTESRENATMRMLIPMAFMMLLWIATFTSGNQLLTSTIEEKSNRVMEVLLSAVSPMQLMTGKILGQAAVSFLMMVIYTGLGIVGLAAATMADLVSVTQLVYFGLYFIMAYFMVASIMAGIGSAVTELRDAQSLITPAMLIMIVPMMLWLPITENPNGALATITSFIPPLIPFVMILRVTSASEQPATLQIIATLIFGYGAMLGMMWMSAKIFRVGVLMYGKPPSPLELLKWLRYS